MFCQGLHGVGYDLLTFVDVVEAITDDEAVQVLVDLSNGLAGANGRFTHIPKGSEIYISYRE